MGRGIIVALALSLAANVFLGGFVAGRFVGGENDRGGDRLSAFRHGDAHEFSDLPPAARESLKRAFIAHRAEGREAYREMKALHREFIDVLSADEFDRAAADAIAAKADAMDRSGRSSLIKLIAEAAEGLSVEDRKALARHIEKRRPHHKRRHGRSAPPPPDAPPAE